MAQMRRNPRSGANAGKRGSEHGLAEAVGAESVAGVKVKPNEPIDRALRRFREQAKRAGILRDAKKSRHYVKPSERRKIAKQRAERRRQKRRNEGRR